MAARHVKTGVTIALLAGAIFVLGATGVLHAVTAPLSGMVSGLAAPAYRIGAAFERARGAVTGAEQEASQVEKLTVEVANLRSLAAENAALKDALAYRDANAKDDAVLARVLSRTDDDTFRGLLIDRGADDGVKVGQPVVTGSGIIIGKVESVRARTAGVMLLLDSRSRLAVALQDDAGTVGVLEGDRGLAMTISLIPLADAVAPGQIAITSGLEPGIKRGLVVGTVESVARGAQDPFQTANVVPMKSASLPVFVQVLRVPDGGAPASP
ncbi:MAG: hypothetical protein RLZZ324_997 [Candidatus Parcubacteria bacterium]|jgi:rod shape-determining protein MreC